jgi:hypothetical protein
MTIYAGADRQDGLKRHDVSQCVNRHNCKSMSTCQCLGILPPLLHDTLCMGTSSQQEIGTAQSISAAECEDPPSTFDALSQGSRGQSLNFSFVESTVPCIPSGSPQHNPWPSTSQAAALDDPLMHPLPFIDGTGPESLSAPLSQSLCASRQFDSISSIKQLQQPMNPACGCVLSDAHNGVYTSTSCQHAKFGVCLHAGAHDASVLCSPSKPVATSVSFSQSSTCAVLPAHVNCSVSKSAPGVDSKFSGINQHPVQKEGLESILPLGTPTMPYVRTWVDPADRFCRNETISVPSSAPSLTLELEPTANASVFDNSVAGFSPVDDRHTASLFLPPPSSYQYTRSVPYRRDESLQMLHTTLCNVASMSEKSALDLRIPGQEIAQGGMLLHIFLLAPF